MDNDNLIPPSKRGNAPISIEDGKPIEIHHEGQNPNGPFSEKTFSNHRGKGNYKENHPNYNKPSKIDRNEFQKQKKAYWKREWDLGRWNNEK